MVPSFSIGPSTLLNDSNHSATAISWRSAIPHCVTPQSLRSRQIGTIAGAPTIASIVLGTAILRLVAAKLALRKSSLPPRHSAQALKNPKTSKYLAGWPQDATHRSQRNATQHYTAHSASNRVTAQSRLQVSLCAFKERKREESARKNPVAENIAEKKQKQQQKRSKTDSSITKRRAFHFAAYSASITPPCPP